MAFTFLAKSSAYSWKMSFVGHVDWKRSVIGACATWMVGAPTAAAAAPTATFLRKLRRDGVCSGFCSTVFFDMEPPAWLGGQRWGDGGPRGCAPGSRDPGASDATQQRAVDCV